MIPAICILTIRRSQILYIVYKAIAHSCDESWVKIPLNDLIWMLFISIQNRDVLDSKKQWYLFQQSSADAHLAHWCDHQDKWILKACSFVSAGLLQPLWAVKHGCRREFAPQNAPLWNGNWRIWTSLGWLVLHSWPHWLTSQEGLLMCKYLRQFWL